MVSPGLNEISTLRADAETHNAMGFDFFCSQKYIVRRIHFRHANWDPSGLTLYQVLGYHHFD